MYTPPPTDPIAYVDWFLNHMQTNLNHDMGQECIWEFTLRTRDVKGMRSLASALRKARYLTAEQESVMETTSVPVAKGAGKGKRKEQWKTVKGPPMVTAFSRGLPSALGLKRRVRSMLALAAKFSGTYSGLSSMDMEEFEMLYGPPKAMSLPDSIWRLRHYSDLGCKKGEKLDFTFGVNAEDTKACKALLKKAGYEKFERAPKDADWAISVVVAGANDEKRLKTAFAAMKKAAKAAGGTLQGVLV